MWHAGNLRPGVEPVLLALTIAACHVTGRSANAWASSGQLANQRRDRFTSIGG
jgi:hypothetical protein